MLSAYERYARENKVLAVPAGYDHVKQLVLNTLYQRAKSPVLVALLTALVLLPFLVAWRYRRKDV